MTIDYNFLATLDYILGTNHLFESNPLGESFAFKIEMKCQEGEL